MTTFHRCRLGRARGDDGSTLVLAMAVMMMLSTLALAGLARSMSVMVYVRHGQSFDAALAAADAGLNDALYRLDTTVPNEAGWTMSGDSGGRAYRYKATRLSPTEYEVESVGTVGKAKHGVRAVVSRGPGYALFTDDELRVGGGGTPGVAGFQLSSYLLLGGPDTGQTHIGSNRAITVEPGADAGDFQHLHIGRSPRGVSCVGCPNEVRHPRPHPLPPVQQPAGATQACPPFGVFTGIVNGAGGQPFVCQRDVQFVGVVSVINGPLVLYVLPHTDTNNIKHHHSLDLRGAFINEGLRAPNVQIYKAGAKPVHLDTTSPLVPRATFNGLLYAPETRMQVQANQWWTGSVVVKALEVRGAPTLTIGFDQDVQRLVNDWTVTRYAEIPSIEADVA